MYCNFIIVVKLLLIICTYDYKQVGEFETIAESDVPDVCLRALEVLPDFSTPDLLTPIKQDVAPKTLAKVPKNILIYSILHYMMHVELS